MHPIPDLLDHLQRETELTRPTLAEILHKSTRLGEVTHNPQQFLEHAVAAIQKSLHALMVQGIEYERIADAEWEMHRLEIEELESYVSRLLETVSRRLSRQVSWATQTICQMLSVFKYVTTKLSWTVFLTCAKRFFDSGFLYDTGKGFLSDCGGKMEGSSKASQASNGSNGVGAKVQASLNRANISSAKFSARFQECESPYRADVHISASSTLPQYLSARNPPSALR